MIEYLLKPNRKWLNKGFRKKSVTSNTYIKTYKHTHTPSNTHIQHISTQTHKSTDMQTNNHTLAMNKRIENTQIHTHKPTQNNC